MAIKEYSPNHFKLSVCANCEKENNERDAVKEFAGRMDAEGHFVMVSHGICPAHYQQTMAARGLD